MVQFHGESNADESQLKVGEIVHRWQNSRDKVLQKKQRLVADV